LLPVKIPAERADFQYNVNNSNQDKMALPNVFTKEVSDQLIARINKLEASSQPKWGKMNVAQMQAHCSVTYEMVYEDKHPKPGAFLKFILKNLVKKTVTNEVPYKHNQRTAPAFLVTDNRQFEVEQQRLIGFIRKTQELGATHFDQKESNSFGKLNTVEWNNMFYKHLDHHLNQFGI
jgi:hypothetical protein